MTENKNSAKGGKPKTRWGCIIAILIIVLVLGGGGYLFYVYIYPVIQKQTKATYTPPTINQEGKERVQNIKDYGEPIKDNEQTGRADPFAPI